MANNFNFDIYSSVCNPSAQRNAAKVCERIYGDMKFSKQNREEIPLSVQRKNAARYFVSNYSLEQRYLIIFERDFSECLNSEKWMKSDAAKQSQKYFDFLVSFEELKEKMKEFRWSKDFLKENGIDFNRIKKLYFALV